jgi:aspartokinase/homoserine dehydrogenase 1
MRVVVSLHYLWKSLGVHFMQKIDHEYFVHKFGGSSLADAGRFSALKSMLKGKNEIIVVSAVQGTTAVLQNIANAAKEGAPFQEGLDALEQTHLQLATKLLSGNKGADIIALIQKDIIEIKDVLHSIQLTRSCSKESLDFLLGHGEIWSSKILTQYLSDSTNVLHLDAYACLYTYEKNGVKCIDWPKSQAAIDVLVAGKIFDQIVVAGYIASTLEGKRSTLGRNGSDFSAAIFSKLFNAKQLTIWTDVDGIYTADPNRVRSAFVIESLSYKEALELAYFGAKVLHPMTIAPALECQIPVVIKNSFNPAAPGTIISSSPKKSLHPIRGLTCIDNVALINIEGTGMTGVSGIAARVFQILHQEGISVILISQASSEHSICFAIENSYADSAANALTENLQFEIERQQIEGVHVDNSCAILSAVGDEMVGVVGVSGKLCDSLAKANINIRAISQGSSERNISVVVSNSDLNRSLQAVHAGFYLSRDTISIGLIGPGLVGSTLLSEIQCAIDQLKSKYNVNLYVRGIMNSKTMLLSHEAIDLRTWGPQFNNCDRAADLQAFAGHILAEDLPHAVIIDCTANQHIAHHYIDFIGKGIHVITPNKHTNAGDLNYYKQLKALALKMHKHYLYEATVCAGLPVINTIQDILKTGDQVLKVEGIVSGTLSYIFNELAKGKVFSEIVKEAKKLGITEPDPREDLSGMDVARKLVCLAREIGHDVSLADVTVHDLVPAGLKSCSIEDFLAQLSTYDEHMQEFMAEAKAKNERLCYVGAIDSQGIMEVTIKAFPASHPFSRLQGTDNMLIFHTRRYNTNPLIIQGPGAGAEVTAAGIFADLLRLVSFLS